MSESVRKMRVSWRARSGLGALALAISAPAWAQDAVQAEQGQDAAASDAGQIVVTGSRIRGVSAVGSNVIAIDRERIEEEPVQSTADLLRRVPQVVTLGANPNGGSAQNGAANATRSSGINLRGLGNTATLLLYDGKRFPPQGTQGQFTDPSVIPTIALSRVEVVADGASAIYGSDAIAGVVNFILRKDFDGVEVSARAGFSDSSGYDEQQAAAIFGKTWSTGSAMIAGEYVRNDALLAGDLPWYQQDNVARGGRDLRTTFCDPGTIVAGGTTYAIPEGGVTPATAAALVPGTSNRCFYNALGGDAVIPEQERKSVVAAASQDLGNRVRIFADGFYSHRDGAIPSIANTTAVVPDTNPFFVSPIPGATSVTVQWSMFPDYGELSNDFWSESWNVTGGIEAQLFGDVEGTFYYAHGESEDVADRRNNGINGAALAEALADPDPATALNVFGGPNNPATLARLIDNYFIIIGATKLDVANLQIDGSVVELPGGKLRFAAGGEYRREWTFTDLVTGTSANQRHTGASGSRNVKAVFGELFIPVFGAGNAQPGLQELSISLAGRWEKYSDFGETSNPKIGVTYEPVRGLRLRGSYGTSFRAPTFTEVSTVAGGAGLYYDTLPGPSGNLTGIGIAGGNPDLEPETATTWSVGAQLQPVALPGFNAEITYFDVNYENQIQALRGTPGLLTNPLYAAFRNLAPTQAEIDALRNSGLPINNPSVSTGVVQFIADGRRQNLGTSKVNGIDFQAAYRWEWGDWRLDAGVNGSYFLKYDFEAVPGAGFADVLNTIAFPQKFRMQADAGIAYGKVRTRLIWNHLSGYQNTTVTPAQDVAALDTFDLFVGFDVNETLTFAGEVRNLFDRDPPFVDTNFGYDPHAANALPRIFRFTARAKF